MLALGNVAKRNMRWCARRAKEGWAMSNLTDVLKEQIKSRDMSDRDFAIEILDLGWEDDAEDVMRVLGDQIIPCHDIIWAAEEVLSLSAEELERLKKAAHTDARERAKKRRASTPGTSLLSALVSALVFVF